MKKVVYVLFLFVSISFAQDLKWDSSALINAEFIKGTTQGVYRKQGKVFKMYALDNLTNEKTYII